MVDISLKMVRLRQPFKISRFGLRQTLPQNGYFKKVDLAVVPAIGVDGAMATDVRSLDPYFDEAAHAVVISQQGSTSMIQRRFSIGYNRAGRLMDQLEAANIVGPAQGSKPRDVLIQDENSLNIMLMQIHGGAE